MSERTLLEHCPAYRDNFDEFVSFRLIPKTKLPANYQKQLQNLIVLLLLLLLLFTMTFKIGNVHL